jgi:hypothetical protein
MEADLLEFAGGASKGGGDISLNDDFLDMQAQLATLPRRLTAMQSHLLRNENSIMENESLIKINSGRFDQLEEQLRASSDLSKMLKEDNSKDLDLQTFVDKIM